MLGPVRWLHTDRNIPWKRNSELLHCSQAEEWMQLEGTLWKACWGRVCVWGGGKSERPELMNFLGGWIWQTTRPWLWQWASPVHRLPRWPSGKESTCQFRRCEFDPWVRKIPWRRKWQPTRVFLPGDFLGQRSLTGYSPWHHKKSDTAEQLNSNSSSAGCVAVSWPPFSPWPRRTSGHSCWGMNEWGKTLAC